MQVQPVLVRGVALTALCLLTLAGWPASSWTEEDAPPPDAPAEPVRWALVHEETFDADADLANDQVFGQDGWLTARIRGEGASITVRDGAAHIRTADFSDSALVRLTAALPPEYRLRLRVGRVDYDVWNYEPADSLDAAFKYRGRWKENGFYWLTLTDRLVEPTSGEEWWHRYRKVVIDSDDHNKTLRPVYMVYMNPDPAPGYSRDKTKPRWIGGVPGLLRCWTGDHWDKRKKNWSVAFRYDDKAWYHVELEKRDGQLIMRAMDADGQLLENMETSPVPLDEIYGMGKQATDEEWAYVGEPHVDSYEGEAWIDDLRLWVPRDSAEGATGP